MEQDNVNQSEVEAGKFGWVPQEDFKGHPDDWRSADEFLKRGREINGYLRKDLDKIKGQNSALEGQLTEMRTTMQEFKQFHEQTADRAYRKALEELKQAKKQAIVEGDGDKVVEIDDQLDELKETRVTKQEKPVTNDKQQQADFNAWHAENSWFGSNRAATALANGLAAEVRAQFPNLQGKPFLEKVAEFVKEELPQAFEKQVRHAAVDSTGSSRPTVGKKSYASLPADARAACDKFVKQKLMTQEQYISEYFSE